MRKFCEFLRERTIKIISFKEKKLKILQNEQQNSLQHPKVCCIVKNVIKLGTIVIIQENIEVLYIVYVI